MQGIIQKNRLRAAAFFVYSLTSVLLFYPGLYNYFSADDFLILLNISGEHYSSVLGHVNFHFMPVTTFFYKLVYSIGGLQPIYFRLLNITVHSLTSTVVLLLAGKIFFNYGKLTQKRSDILAFFCGFLFCVHFIHTETVIYFSCLHELLYSFFYICAVYLFFKYKESGSKSFFYLMILFFLLSLLSKETALSFLLLLFFLEVFLNKRTWAGFFKEYFPALASAVLYFILRILIQNRMSPIQPESAFGAVVSEILKNIIFSFTAMFFSLDFLSIKDVYKSPHADLITLIKNIFISFPWLPVVLLAVVFLYYLLLRKRDKISYFAAGFMLLTIISFIWLTAYERYLYLPSFAFCLLFLYYIYRLYNKGKIFRVISVSIFVIFIFYNIYGLEQKQQNWITASNISQTAVNNILSITSGLPQGSVVYFRDLPDNYKGAWIFRDGVQYLPELYINRSDLKFEKIYDENVHTEIANKIYVFKYSEGKIFQD